MTKESENLRLRRQSRRLLVPNSTARDHNNSILPQSYHHDVSSRRAILSSGIHSLARKFPVISQGRIRTFAIVFICAVFFFLLLSSHLVGNVFVVLPLETELQKNPISRIKTPWEQTKYYRLNTSSDVYYELYQNTSGPTNKESTLCSCLSCLTSETTCGGLWFAHTTHNETLQNGAVQPPMSSSDPTVTKKIIVVVSHCKSDISWIEDFIAGYEIERIDVISKCGYWVYGAPEGSNIIRLPNLGRCDHTYAWWILRRFEEEEEDRKIALQDDTIIVFLKDDMSLDNNHQYGKWRTLETILQIVDASNFACAMLSSGFAHLCNSRDEKKLNHCSGDLLSLSAFHVKDILFQFSMNEYHHNTKGYHDVGSSFRSNYSNLGDWISSLPNVDISSDLVQVCYGGAFAVKWKQVRSRQQHSVWTTLEASLQRGNSIEEGHFAERSWAALLSSPPTELQRMVLRTASDGIYMSDLDYKGSLVRKPKLYLHVGPPDGDAFHFRKNIKHFSNVLLRDGYHYASDPAFYNIVPCLNFQRYIDLQLVNDFPDDWTEICDSYKYYYEAHDYFLNMINNGYDAIASDNRLSLPGLSNIAHILRDLIDVHVVILYYRLYDMLIRVFILYRQQSQLDVSDTITEEYFVMFKELPENFRYRRLVDFVRYSIQWLLGGKSLGRVISNQDAFGSDPLKVNTFHKELFSEVMVHYADILVHPALIAEQYERHEEFAKNIHIINVYSGDPSTTLFCELLQYAPNTCQAVIDRVSKTKVDINEWFSDPTNIQLAYEDMALAAMSSSKSVYLDSLSLQGIEFSMHVKKWSKVIESRLVRMNQSVSDLPKECLNQDELRVILTVSQKYEELLLPEFYHSASGLIHLREDFERKATKFCSIDTDSILQSQEWSSLFDPIDMYMILPNEYHEQPSHD